jgi:hypothetical protein
MENFTTKPIVLVLIVENSGCNWSLRTSRAVEDSFVDGESLKDNGLLRPLECLGLCVSGQ